MYLAFGNKFTQLQKLCSEICFLPKLIKTFRVSSNSKILKIYLNHSINNLPSSKISTWLNATLQIFLACTWKTKSGLRKAIKMLTGLTLNSQLQTWRGLRSFQAILLSVSLVESLCHSTLSHLLLFPPASTTFSPSHSQLLSMLFINREIGKFPDASIYMSTNSVVSVDIYFVFPHVTTDGLAARIYWRHLNLCTGFQHRINLKNFLLK